MVGLTDLMRFKSLTAGGSAMNMNMLNLNRGTLAALLLAATCLWPASLRAVGPEVRDSAGLFSASAVKQADDSVRRIQRDFRKDLLVETFPGVPESRTQDYQQSREKFFSSFVVERAEAARIDGIYVLIMKEPPPHRYRIQVAVGQNTRQRAFTLADRDELVRVFQTSFRQDKYDDALRIGVAFVETPLRSILQRSRASQPAASVGYASSSRSSIGSFLILRLFLLGAILLVGVLIRLMRGGMGGGVSPGMGGGFGGGGGGGFFSSMLGGIGGAIAGSWLYDRFMGGNAHASDGGYNQGPSDSPSSDVGGDWSSSGGDVDSSSGGGDFGGGGDSGGGGGGGGDA